MNILSVLVLGFALAAATPTVTVPFSTRLFAEISAENPTKNVIFSPASIKSALGLAYMGAEGSTATELYNVLHLSGNTKQEVGVEFGKFLGKVHGSRVEVKTANRIYLNKEYTIAPTYNELVSMYFGAVAKSVDFAKSTETAQQINSWVEEQTNHKIHEIIHHNDIDETTKAVLVNAVYFKANWRYAFKKQKTQEMPFHVSKEQTTPVKMMHGTMNVGYAELPQMNAKAIELPYTDSDIKMLIILPNEVDGLANLEHKLKEVDFTHFQMQVDKVNLRLPKFKIEFSTSLNNYLKNLGIHHMFSDADFSSMITTGGKSLTITQVKHKAFIEVDEHGTEAAGVTALTANRSLNAGRELSFDFFADHPFFFAIKDEHTVYFAGHVTKF